MTNTTSNPWDSRYSGDTYIYGTTPNEWVFEQLTAHREIDSAITPLNGARALELASGEGRNAVFLAEQGLLVTAVDASQVGIKKTRALAQSRGVTLEAIHADALTWRPDSPFDLVITTSFHVPSEQKPALFETLRAAVKPGGLLIAEWFHPDQRNRGYTSGGPPSPHMMFTPGEIREGLPDFDITRLEHTERHVQEGPKHDGLASVVSLLARKRVIEA